MKEEKIQNLILEYIRTDTGEIRRKQIQNILLQNGYDIGELLEMQDVYNKIDEIPIPELSERMDSKFYSTLEEYKIKNKVSKIGLWKSLFTYRLGQLKNAGPKLAYAAILIFLGIGIGYWIIPQKNYEEQISYLSTEVSQMKEAVMLTMLQQQSAVERIKAVNSTSGMNDVDSKIIDALLTTLNNDPNVNVRLVTIEALTKFVDKPAVREGLIQSITKQNSPVVQLTLAELMVALQEKSSVEQLQELLERKDLNDVVRTNIQHSISEII